ncbi:MAG: DUF1385 domain-containing protein [Lachnospiraceae bacterium]|nr:DUF1385 domain-containing protein [Lachnospiraceae bacterium]
MSRKVQHYSGIGGQAVLEGVMMKNGDTYAVAVRRPDGEIETEMNTYRGILADTPVKKIPFVRGIFVFIDSLVLGLKSLNYSSSFYEEEGEPSKADEAMDRITGGNGEKFFMGITMVLSFALAIGLFILLPWFLSEQIGGFVRNQSLIAISEGVLRLVIFLVYMAAITLMKDIRRLYQYHGAEHKCINCIESGKELNVENVMKSTRFHKRCGTSFMILVMIISIILFFFIRVDSRLMRLGLRLLLIPVIAGISYEIIRFAGSSDNIFVRIVSAPGIWLQHLTTKEPDEKMAEVAIRSVEAVFDWRQYLKENFSSGEESGN